MTRTTGVIQSHESECQGSARVKNEGIHEAWSRILPVRSIKSYFVKSIKLNNAFDNPSCKICNGNTAPFGACDFNKFCSTSEPMKFGFANVSINYNKCCDCDFIFTVDFDDWSEKDFSENIYNDDYIRVDGEYPVVRPQRMADNVSKLLKNFKNERLLDYGSGSGVFERKIRQSGFENVSSFDPFSNPIRPSGQFSIVTAFEVVEHSTDPIGIFTDMLSFANNEAIIIISTGLQPKNIAELGLSWWYIAPRNGHVSI
jgi:hypothetical protein